MEIFMTLKNKLEAIKKGLFSIMPVEKSLPAPCENTGLATLDERL